MSPREYLEFTERERFVPEPPDDGSGEPEEPTDSEPGYISEPGEPGPRGPPGVSFFVGYIGIRMLFLYTII